MVLVGSPAMTMRGFDEDDFHEVGGIICQALDRVAGTSTAARAS